ncbi:MAG: hypothetical protein KDC48_19285, partial [Planctomycetes bacterium]|nr:hypothetical protein [Planctomycetota bacterium]
DLLLVGTDSPDYVTPATSVVVQHKLGARNAGTFDIGCACASFPTGLATAAGWIAANPSMRSILVVGVYLMHKLADPDDPMVFFYGDGAGAALLEPAEAPGFVSAAAIADGAYAGHWGIYSGGTAEPASEESVRAGRTRVKLLERYPPEINHEGWPRVVRKLAENGDFALEEIDRIKGAHRFFRGGAIGLGGQMALGLLSGTTRLASERVNFGFDVLFTLDARYLTKKAFPFRFTTNIGWILDNSLKVLDFSQISDTTSREVTRFALGVNHSRVRMRYGVDFPLRVGKDRRLRRLSRHVARRLEVQRRVPGRRLRGRRPPAVPHRLRRLLLGRAGGGRHAPQHLLVLARTRPRGPPAAPPGHRLELAPRRLVTATAPAARRVSPPRPRQPRRAGGVVRAHGSRRAGHRQRPPPRSAPEVRTEQPRRSP